MPGELHPMPEIGHAIVNPHKHGPHALTHCYEIENNRSALQFKYGTVMPYFRPAIGDVTLSCPKNPLFGVLNLTPTSF